MTIGTVDKLGLNQPYADRSDLRLQCLGVLRFPLALIVVFNHCFDIRDFSVGGEWMTIADFPLYATILSFIDAFLRGYSVPIYFFISGFLFFLWFQPSKKGYLGKLRRRVNTLLIPYIVWNAVAIVLMLVRVLPIFGSLSPFTEARANITPSSILSCFWTYDGSLISTTFAAGAMEQEVVRGTAPIDGPLWFIRNLMILVLLTPLIYWIIKKAKHYFLLLFTLLYILLPYSPIDDVYGLLPSLYFFSWGAYLTIHHHDIALCFGRFFKTSMVLFPMLALLHVFSQYFIPEASITIKLLNTIVAPVFAYNIAYWLLRKGICKVHPFLVSAGMFLYVGHAMLVGPIAHLFMAFIPPLSSIAQIIIYSLTFVVASASLLIAFYLMRRFTPNLLKATTGRF